MLSLEISRALLLPETQKALSLPTAALILGALSQVDSLIELAERVCDPVVRRSNITTSNQELASHIGTVRELVSRNLSRLQAEGMLQIDGRTVTISNLKALEAEIDSPE